MNPVSETKRLIKEFSMPGCPAMSSGSVSLWAVAEFRVPVKDKQNELFHFKAPVRSRIFRTICPYPE
jgi:hypothetical protein